MDADVRRTELDAKTVKRIWSKAMQLSKQEGFRPDEWPDLQQEMVVHVLEQLLKYDPRRGKREHFLASIISHKATDMLRIRRAKRRGHQVEVVSLHEQVATAGDEQVLVEDLVADDALQVQRGLSGRHGGSDPLPCRCAARRGHPDGEAAGDLSPAALRQQDRGSERAQDAPLYSLRRDPKDQARLPAGRAGRVPMKDGSGVSRRSFVKTVVGTALR